jgi:hypothetical protein
MVSNRCPTYGMAGFAVMIVKNTAASDQHESRQGNQGNDRVEAPLPHSTHLTQSDAERRTVGATRNEHISTRMFSIQARCREKNKISANVF